MNFLSFLQEKRVYRFAKYTHWGQGHLVSSEKVSWETYSHCCHCEPLTCWIFLHIIYTVNVLKFGTLVDC